MWNSSMTIRDSIVSGVAYAIWRLGRGDVMGGVWRKVRRSFGIYKADSISDNTEYHAVRKGVDQVAISARLEKLGMQCTVIEYCSFHGALLQPLGESMGIRNTFAIIANKGLGEGQSLVDDGSVA